MEYIHYILLAAIICWALGCVIGYYEGRKGRVISKADDNNG